jgi:LuxR family quorum-sensing system transcriptional regulator CciR
MRISDFIELTNAAGTSEEVFELFRRAVAEFGFDRIALAAVTLSAREAPVADRASLMLNFPDTWIKRYFEMRYQNVDPVLSETQTRARPFTWRDILESQPLLPKQKQMFREAEEDGLRQGLSIPMHGPMGQCYVISLATGDSAMDDVATQGKLQILATQFFLAHSALIQSASEASAAPLVLTERERECLTWTARGKSAWAISMILGVSENTVHFHIKNIMKKLGSVNRIQAVVTAVRSGLILP